MEMYWEIYGRNGIPKSWKVDEGSPENATNRTKIEKVWQLQVFESEGNIDDVGLKQKIFTQYQGRSCISTY
jgi:hypothetical protein